MSFKGLLLVTMGSKWVLLGLEGSHWVEVGYTMLL